ncbi:MAG: hypothetical protein IPN34_03915 [Planctomycetes bacterium]|nr:hypothetical protein [Planctomycetota bacterium]
MAKLNHERLLASIERSLRLGWRDKAKLHAKAVVLQARAPREDIESDSTGARLPKGAPRGAEEDPDELLTLMDACDMLKRVKKGRITKEQLRGLRRKGLIPEPDERGGFGRADRWRASALLPRLEAHYKVRLAT